MQKPQLVGTPNSHFTRKIRFLCAELGVELDFVRTPSLLDTAAASYGDNPLLRIPTFVHDGQTIVESDHIARYVVATWDPGDRFGVRSERVEDLNRLAVINGIMGNEVVLILAKRGGLEDLDGVAYFRKLSRSMEEGLAWLDARTDVDATGFDYRDIGLVCMWQHAAHFGFVAGLERFPRIAARVARFAERASVAPSTPA